MTAEPDAFAAPDNAALTGLVFELASQLHVERTRRQALEAALVRKALVTPEEIEAAGNVDAFRRENEAALDRSIRKLLDILTESTDRRVPLRAEAPAQGGR